MPAFAFVVEFRFKKRPASKISNLKFGKTCVNSKIDLNYQRKSITHHHPNENMKFIFTLFFLFHPLSFFSCLRLLFVSCPVWFIAFIFPTSPLLLLRVHVI